MRDFIESHWGDLIGLLLLYTGIAIVVWAACAASPQALSHLGESLVLAAMGVLKLRGIERKTASGSAAPSRTPSHGVKSEVGSRKSDASSQSTAYSSQ